MHLKCHIQMFRGLLENSMCVFCGREPYNCIIPDYSFTLVTLISLKNIFPVNCFINNFILFVNIAWSIMYRMLLTKPNRICSPNVDIQLFSLCKYVFLLF